MVVAGGWKVGWGSSESTSLLARGRDAIVGLGFEWGTSTIVGVISVPSSFSPGGALLMGTTLRDSILTIKISQSSFFRKSLKIKINLFLGKWAFLKKRVLRLKR